MITLCSAEMQLLEGNKLIEIVHLFRKYTFFV